MHRTAVIVLTVVFLAAALLTAAPASRAGKASQKSYVLALDIVWGDPAGPESWRVDLERSVANELGRRGCFTSIQRFDVERTPENALVLRIVISDFRERSTYGVNIAALQSPDAAPDTKQSHVAEAKAIFDLELLSLPSGVRIRKKHFGEAVAYRPQMDEDPRYESRRRLLEAVGKTVAIQMCKGSPNKFEKELARALAAARPAPDPSE